MTETLTITAKKRNPSRQENRFLEEERRVLGVVYGHGFEPLAVSVDASDILRIYRKAGNSSLVELDIEGKKETVILKEVSLHPVKHEISHIDFFVVNLKEKTVVNVDLKFIGKSAGVDTFGGELAVNSRSIDIKCLPADSPRNIEVDKSLLTDIGSVITVKELGLDVKKYEVIGMEEDAIICSVTAKKIEEVKEDEAAAEKVVEGEKEEVKE